MLLALECLHSHLCDDKIVALSTPQNTARQIYVLFRMNSEQIQMTNSHPVSYLTFFSSVLESYIIVCDTNSSADSLDHKFRAKIHDEDHSNDSLHH